MLSYEQDIAHMSVILLKKQDTAGRDAGQCPPRSIPPSGLEARYWLFD